MKKNTAIITGLFMLLILTFTINPAILYSFQDSILGKLIIVITLVYLTMNSVTLGLLFVLILILLSNHFDTGLVEGLKNRKRKPVKRNPKKVTPAQLRAKARAAADARKKAQAEARKKAQEEADAEQDYIDNVDNGEDLNLDGVDINQNLEEFENLDDYVETDLDTGVDRIAIEDTLRVRNPSTIPVNREQFSMMGDVKPFDNTAKTFSGTCSSV
jgi:hypothetical protein